jgi:hypothetical protein
LLCAAKINSASGERKERAMPDEKRDDKPTQTTPKGKEIPVPTREDFLRDLRKVAPPAKSDQREDQRHDSR